MLLDAINARGFAVITGLLDRDYALTLRDEIVAALSRPPDAARDTENLRNPSRTASSVLELDWIRLVRAAMTPSVKAAHLDLLGADASIVFQHSRIRRQYAPRNRPTEHVIHHWHSDAGVGYAPGKLSTLWITLDDCGDDAPSLEFLARANPPQMPGEHDEAHFTSAYGSDDRHVVRAKVGDALLFPATTFHRTYVAESMMRDRVSIDVRCTGADRPPNLADCDTRKLADICP